MTEPRKLTEQEKQAAHELAEREQALAIKTERLTLEAARLEIDSLGWAARELAPVDGYKHRVVLTRGKLHQRQTVRADGETLVSAYRKALEEARA